MFHTQEEEGVTVVGLSKVVSSADPAAIGALWEAFHASDLRKELGAGACESVHCVYHDYEGGFRPPTA